MLSVSHHQIRKLIKAGILASEQVMPDAPHQIRAADLASEQVITALKRKGCPCRVDPKDRFQCFQTLGKEVHNKSIIAIPRSARSAALLVRQIRPSSRKRVKASIAEHVVHRLGDLGMPGEPGAFGSHPLLESRDERRDARAANGHALGGGAAVDLALGIEDRIDALDRFERQRGNHGELAARLGGDIGEHEELAPAMRPAGGFLIGPGRRPAS